MKRFGSALLLGVFLALGLLLGASRAHAADDTTLPLNANRFQVKVAWKTTAGLTGSGHGVSLTGDSGYFWFFDAANVELILKVLDACSINQKFWVFAGGLTDVMATITITDTRTSVVKTYTNPLSTAFRPIQDTAAFNCP